MNLQRQFDEAQWALDAVTQDRDQWKAKFQKAQNEIVRAKTEAIYNGREIQQLREDYGNVREELSTRNTQLSNANSKIDTLLADLEIEKSNYTTMYTSFKAQVVKEKAKAERGEGPSDDEFERQLAIIESLREENAVLTVASHPGESCQQYGTQIWYQLQDAQDLQAAAEAERDALLLMDKQNELLSKQHDEDSLCLAALRQENMKLTAQLAQAPQSTQRTNLQNAAAEESQQSLEEELKELLDQPASSEHSSQYPPLSSEPTPPRHYGHPSPELFFKVPRAETLSLPASAPSLAAPAAQPPVTLAFSSISAVSAAPMPLLIRSVTTPTPVLPRFTLGLSRPHQPLTPIGEDTLVTSPPVPSILAKQAVTNASKLNVALTVNIRANDNKARALLSRVQSAISKTSTLDVQGPTTLVEEFVHQMNKVDSDHRTMVNEVAGLKKDNRDLRTELYNRPRCIVPGHKDLETNLEVMNDELHTRDVTLRVQARLLEMYRADDEQ
ncbi:hypothetical protein NX059_000895 [Plenodomus lindquistii]|nr:hypothetical protein NX059_000895 [Plenodomus lindquistii]